jgi:hypothetical protein
MRSVKSRLGLLGAVVFATAATQASPDHRVAGIVELPALFGTTDPNGPPGQRPPERAESVPVHAAPDSASEVLARIARADDIESREFTYEALGALSYGDRRSWHLVRARTDTGWALGWLSPRYAGPFHPLDSLLLDGLTYLTEAWDGRLFPSAGAETESARLAPAPTNRDIVVQQARRIQDALWLEVEVLAPGRCEGPGAPAVVARGWIRAHGRDGSPTAWFYSRGC